MSEKCLNAFRIQSLQDFPFLGNANGISDIISHNFTNFKLFYSDENILASFNCHRHNPGFISNDDINIISISIILFPHGRLQNLICGILLLYCPGYINPPHLGMVLTIFRRKPLLCMRRAVYRNLINFHDLRPTILVKLTNPALRILQIPKPQT